MTKAFIDRVIREGIVDTKAYRYTYVALPNECFIKRLPIADLDTTRAINGWEKVVTF